MKKLVFYRILWHVLCATVWLSSLGVVHTAFSGIKESDTYLKVADVMSSLETIQERLKVIKEAIGSKQSVQGQPEKSDEILTAERVKSTFDDLADCGEALFSSLGQRAYDKSDPRSFFIKDVVRYTDVVNVEGVLNGWKELIKALKTEVTRLPLAKAIAVLRNLHSQTDSLVKTLAGEKCIKEAVLNYREVRTLLEKELFVKKELEARSNDLSRVADSLKGLGKIIGAISVVFKNDLQMLQGAFFNWAAGMVSTLRKAVESLRVGMGDKESLSREECLKACKPEEVSLITEISFRDGLMSDVAAWSLELLYRVNESMKSMAHRLKNVADKLMVDKHLAHDEQRAIIHGAQGIIDNLPEIVPMLKNLGLQSIIKHFIKRSASYVDKSGYSLDEQKSIGRFFQAASTVLGGSALVIGSCIDLGRIIATSKTDEEFQAYLAEKAEQRKLDDEYRDDERSYKKEMIEEERQELNQMGKNYQVLLKIPIPGAHKIPTFKDMTGKSFSVIPTSVGLYRGEFSALASLFLQTTLDFYFFKELQQEKERHIVESLLKEIPKTLTLLTPLEVEKSQDSAADKDKAKGTSAQQKESFLKRLLTGKLLSFTSKSPEKKVKADTIAPKKPNEVVPEQPAAPSVVEKSPTAGQQVAPIAPPLSRTQRVRRFLKNEWEGVDADGQPQPGVLSRLLGGKYTPALQRTLKINRFIKQHHTLVNYNIFQSPAIQTLLIFFLVRQVIDVLSNYNSFLTLDEAHKIAMTWGFALLEKVHPVRERRDEAIRLWKKVFFPHDPLWKWVETWKDKGALHDRLKTSEGIKSIPISTILKEIVRPDTLIAKLPATFIKILDQAGAACREMNQSGQSPSRQQTPAESSQAASAFKEALAEIAIRFVTFSLTIRFLDHYQTELWTGYVHTYQEPLHKLLTEYQECGEKGDEASLEKRSAIRKKIELFVHNGNSLVGRGLLSHLKGASFMKWLRMMTVSSMKAGMLVTTALALPNIVIGGYYAFAWIYKTRNMK